MLQVCEFCPSFFFRLLAVSAAVIVLLSLRGNCRSKSSNPDGRISGFLKFVGCFTLLPLIGAFTGGWIAEPIAEYQDRGWTGLIWSGGATILLFAAILGLFVGLALSKFVFFRWLRT